MNANDFKAAIASAAWNQNLFQFCERTGWNPESDYAQKKFSEFQELAGLLNKFDSTTLAQIIGAQDDGLDAAIDKAIEEAGRTDTEGEAEVLQLARMLREKADRAESLFIAK